MRGSCSFTHSSLHVAFFVFTMAAILFWTRILCILLFCAQSKVASSNRTIFSPSPSSGCTCDLTGNACDTNCCCDPDCSAGEKEAFTECKDADINQDSSVCVSSDLLYIQNTKFRIKATGTGLFCIYKDNYNPRNIYNDIRSASTAADFTKLKDQASRTIFENKGLTQTKPTTASTYKAGDPIILVFENDAKGFLSLPKPLLTQGCDDLNPAGYLQDGNSECTRTITDLASQCNSLPYLAAKSFYTGFKVAKNPSIYFGNITNATITVNVTSSVTNATNFTTTSTQSVTTWLLNDTLLLDVNVTQPVLCRTDLGVLNDCGFSAPPNPSFDAVKKTCSNVVFEATYTLQWNSTTDLTKVRVAFVLGELSSNNRLPLLQKYSVKFQKESSEPFQRSGNPGYLVGKPVIAGMLQIDAVTKTETIQLNNNPTTWLTIAGPSTDGFCTKSTQRLPVAFGMDYRTGCIISVSLATSASACQVLQDTTLSALLGSVPTHVASFGNSDVNKVGDWVKILNTKPTQKVEGGNGICSNMVMGLKIEVLYSNFGFLANPQAKIVGVQFKYDDPKEIKFQCFGPYCQLGNAAVTQRFEVITSVEFIDVSSKPNTLIKPRPAFEAKAPSDFFYPFL